MSGTICPVCGTVNAHGTLVCSNCGAALAGEWTMKTVSLGNAASGTNRFRKQRIAHIGKLPPHAAALYINNGETPSIVLITSEIIFGRNVAGDETPRFDLTNFQGQERGVSRKHAILKRIPEGIIVEDMGSSNGTWLNDSLLKPFTPSLLQSGDRLRLSQVEVEIYFAEKPAVTEK